MHGKFGTKYIGVKKQNIHVARASGSTAKIQPHAEKFMITIHVKVVGHLQSAKSYYKGTYEWITERKTYI